MYLSIILVGQSLGGRDHALSSEWAKLVLQLGERSGTEFKLYWVFYPVSTQKLPSCRSLGKFLGRCWGVRISADGGACCNQYHMIKMDWEYLRARHLWLILSLRRKCCEDRRPKMEAHLAI